MSGHDLDFDQPYDGGKLKEFGFPSEIVAQSLTAVRCRRCGAFINPNSDSILTKICPGAMVAKRYA